MKKLIIKKFQITLQTPVIKMAYNTCNEVNKSTGEGSPEILDFIKFLIKKVIQNLNLQILRLKVRRKFIKVLTAKFKLPNL